MALLRGDHPLLSPWALRRNGRVLSCVAHATGGASTYERAPTDTYGPGFECGPIHPWPDTWGGNRPAAAGAAAHAPP
jgi:hypothetical protein